MTVAPPAAPPDVPSTDLLQQDLARLQQANYYLTVALDQCSEGVILFKPAERGRDPQVIYHNCQASLLAGVEPDTGLRLRSVADLAASEQDADILRVAFKDAMGSMGGAECVSAMSSSLAPEGILCRWQVRAVVDEHGNLLNYTVRVQREEEVSASAVMEAEDLDAQTKRMRTENMAALAQGIAHDVNNLLGPVMAQLSSTLSRVEQDSGIGTDLQMMFGALKRARQFTQQVVNTAKAKADQRQPVDLLALARETARLCGAGSNVDIQVSGEGSAAWAQADPVRMTQVLQNLIMNGIQAMRNGGRLDVVLGEVSLEPDNPCRLAAGDHVVLQVRDRGVGIPESDLKRLFKESFTTKPDGNGIGLTTIQRFVQEHEGHIGVESTVNVGTVFTVHLPSAEGPEECDTPGTTDAAPIPLQKGSGRVLLVDDEDPLRHVAKCILTQCGYSVTECDSGETAVELYRQLSREGQAPDVVLMDLTLRGGLTGSEAAAEILALDRDARLVVTSGSVTEDVQRVFLEQGFVGVLPKPYEAGALTVKVADVIRLGVG